MKNVHFTDGETEVCKASFPQSDSKLAIPEEKKKCKRSVSSGGLFVPGPPRATKPKIGADFREPEGGQAVVTSAGKSGTGRSRFFCCWQLLGQEPVILWTACWGKWLAQPLLNVI